MPTQPTHFAMPSRRSVLRGLACGCAAALAGPVCSGVARAADTSHAPATTFSADEVLANLRQGNANFVNDRPQPVLTGRERRLQIAQGQTPFAVFVGCSDSRVPPELVFGSGLGEFFVVRVAGNSVDRTALGSIEYGVGALGCPLVVVMGHERCGAVQAAIQMVQDDKRFPGAISEMVAPIIPAVLRAQKMTGDLVENAVKENVRSVVLRLRTSDEVLSSPVAQGKVKVVGAYYNLGSGEAEFLS